jgi:hypothetical protein
MKLVIAAAAVAVVCALAAPAAHAQSDLAAPPPDPSIAGCKDAAQVHGPALLIPGFGEAIARCMEHHTMRRDVRNCLIATGITLAGVAVGGVIGGTAARVIAGNMVSTGSAVCVGLIVGT